MSHTYHVSILQAATVKRKHEGQQKMMKDKQNLNKNTGKRMQAKMSKKMKAIHRHRPKIINV